MDLLERVTHRYEFANVLATRRTDPVVGETQYVQTLLFLVGQSLDDNGNALVSYVVAAQVQLFDRLAQT